MFGTISGLWIFQSTGKECNMEMCYDGALVMPNNYAVVNEEEMTYIDGGSWATYTGKDALKTLTVIAGCAYTHVMSAIEALDGAALIAGCSGGLALVASLGIAVGASLLIGLGAEEACYVIAAATYMINSYSVTKNFRCSGYKANLESFWVFTYCKGVDTM